MANIDSTRLAVALYWDLHSSADENFNSSLLAAALNENLEFRKWLAIAVAEFDPNFPLDSLIAYANDSLPKSLTNACGDGQVYRRPDLFLRGIGDQELWDALDGPRPSLSSTASLPAIFVEIKWNRVSDDDYCKYVAFLQQMARFPKFRFVLITSLAPRVMHRIKTKAIRKDEDSMHKLLNDNRLRVVTYEDVLGALGKTSDLATSPCQCPATVLARDYFHILVTRETCLDYWSHACAVASRVRSRLDILREEIVDAAVDIALYAGFITRFPRLSDNEERNVLKFDTSTRKVSTEPQDAHTSMVGLVISIDDLELHFDLNTIDPCKIVSQLEKLKKALSLA